MGVVWMMGKVPVDINLLKNIYTGFSFTFIRKASACVRVRFAPSPTGYLHVGGLRTALYNYLFAKAHNGSFILRIEDTDQTRLVDGAVEKLEEDLRWVGLHPDEGPTQGGLYGPYIQSKRLDLYRNKANDLLAKNRAYYCFCTDRRLDLLRKDALRRREVPKYDNYCRHLSTEEIQEKLAAQIPHCIRFKLTSFLKPFNDLVYGLIKNDVMKTEGDPVILKSDGFPTYHLANVVDDHYMQISHVLRGVEWQSSTVKHLLLYEAFDWEPPAYAHLPLLLNEDGTKLSKRHGDMTVESYRRKGICPHALINFLTTCGGGFIKDKNTNTVELKSISDLTKMFSLDFMNANNCQLPLTKLKDFNRAALKQMFNDEKQSQECINRVRELVATTFPEIKSTALLSDVKLKKALEWSINNNRVSFLNEFVEPHFSFLWKRPSESSILKHDRKLFETLPTLMKNLENFDFEEAALNAFFKIYAQENHLKYSEFMKFLRSCLSGLKEGPSVAEMFILLGKEESFKRLRRNILDIKSQTISNNMNK